MIFPLSATSQSIDIEILDDSGLPVTSLVAATFPTLTYSLAGANASVAFPALSDLAAETTAYSSGGVKERGNGVYRLDLPNGIFTTAGQVRIRGEATGKHVICPWLEVGNVPADAKAINAVSTSSVTAVNANVGTTQPVNFTGTAGSALVKGDAVDIAGAAVNAGAAQLGVNVVNYAGTAAAVGADNLPKVGVWGFLGTLFTESVGGNIAAAFKKAFDVASSVWTTASINQTGDSYSRIGANGGALTALAPASTALSNATWTSARAAYLDNLNIGGAAASHADIIAINLSATKHVLLKTVGQYEPGEQYTIELNTFDATTGEPVNADSTPSLTATGKVSGSLSANLSAVTNSATGVYLWTYTPGASPPLEEIRFSASPSVNGVVRTISTYAQTVDFATAVFTSTDQSHLTSIFNKLPANNIADETTLAAAIALCQQAGAAVTLPTNPPANWLNAAAIAAGALDGKGDWATAGAQMDLVNAPNATALAAIANAYLNLANGIETGITPLQAERAILAVLCGKLTVSGSNPEVFQNPAGTANRVSVANDTAGNRSAVTITA